MKIKYYFWSRYLNERKYLQIFNDYSLNKKL